MCIVCTYSVNCCGFRSVRDSVSDKKQLIQFQYRAHRKVCFRLKFESVSRLGILLVCILEDSFRGCRSKLEFEFKCCCCFFLFIYYFYCSVQSVNMFEIRVFVSPVFWSVLLFYFVNNSLCVVGCQKSN